jgi:dienelactone hydrolase
VIAHDCSGLGPRSSGAPARWASLLASQGYVIMMPDSFSPRDFPDGICTAPPDTSAEKLRRVSPLQRAYDAYAALAYLRRQDFVDGAHVGIMGGSHGGSTTLVAMAQPTSDTVPLAEERLHGFAAGVALYPGCGARYGSWSVVREAGTGGPVTAYVGAYRAIAPLLILIGGADDWTPAEYCQALADKADQHIPVRIKVYPGARHSFDSSAPQRFVATRRNENAPGGRGATTGGDPAAWADAIDEVTRFFATTLKDDARP